jgi:hypothetical protein
MELGYSAAKSSNQIINLGISNVYGHHRGLIEIHFKTCGGRKIIQESFQVHHLC